MTIGSLSLPAGSYFLQANPTMHNEDSDPQLASCRFKLGTDTIVATVDFIAADGNEPLPVQSLLVLPSPATVDLACNTWRGLVNWENDTRFTALSVGGVN